MVLDPIVMALVGNGLAWAFSAGGVIAELRSIRGRLVAGAERMAMIEADARRALERIGAQEARCEERTRGGKV